MAQTKKPDLLQSARTETLRVGQSVLQVHHPFRDFLGQRGFRFVDSLRCKDFLHSVAQSPHVGVKYHQRIHHD